jgi:hypothetical protein
MTEPTKPDATERAVWVIERNGVPTGGKRHVAEALVARERSERIVRYVPETALLEAQLAVLDELDTLAHMNGRGTPATSSDYATALRRARAQLAAQSGSAEKDGRDGQ